MSGNALRLYQSSTLLFEDAFIFSISKVQKFVHDAIMFGAGSLNRKGHFFVTILCAVILLVVYYLLSEQEFLKGTLTLQKELLHRRNDEINVNQHGDRNTLTKDKSDERFKKRAAELKRACERFQEKLDKEEVGENLLDKADDIKKASERMLEKLDRLHPSLS